MTETTAPSIYPTMRYEDARAAIDFLVKAFGFVEEQVYEQDDVIVHALLSYGNGMIMMSTAGASDPMLNARPSLYIAVDDPDAHHARAVAAGAEIVMPLTDQDYGSREYAASDPEGNVWSFGTYRPAPRLGG